MSSTLSSQSGRLEFPKPGCEGAMSRRLFARRGTKGCSSAKPPPPCRKSSGRPRPASKTSISTSATWHFIAGTRYSPKLPAVNVAPPSYGGQTRMKALQLAGTLYTEVVAQHYIVALQFRGGAGEADLALVHDVVAVANRERSRQVLLDQENSQALLFQSRQHLDDLLHDHGRKSLGWLVEKK